MSSRRDQKDQLRREREEREAATKSAQRRRQLIGYGAGGAVVLVAVVVAVVLLAGGGGGSASAGMLPDGGDYPEPQEIADVEEAAELAGCELASHRADNREHVADLSQEVDYETSPPTSGTHFQEWAEDDAYEEAPDAKELVHTMEHGRVIVWFDKQLPAEQRAALKAYYDDDSYQLVLVPDETGMEYAVAATAWNRDPRPNGTGRLMGCPEYNDDVFTALETFKANNRGVGPEPVP